MTADIETLTYKDDAPAAKSPEPPPSVGEGSGEGESKGMFSPDESGLKKAVGKITIKLGKLGQAVADIEQFVYQKFGLNKLMQPTEIELERKETADDMGILIETRIKIISKYGDIINVIIDFVSHIATRAFRFYALNKEQQNAFAAESRGEPAKQEQQNTRDPDLERVAAEMGVSYEDAARLAGR